MLETTFVKVCDLNPLTFPKIDKASRFSKIIASVVNASAFVFATNEFFSIRIKDIRVFIYLLIYTSYSAALPVNFLHIFNQDLETVNFYLLQDSDEAWGQVDTTGSKFFYLLVGSIVMEFVSLARNIPSRFIMLSFLVVGDVFAMYQLASLKFMVSKRFRWMLDQARIGGNIICFLPAVRKLSVINERINRVHSLKLALVLASNFGPYLSSLNAFWEVYGLHKHTDTWEERNPFLTVFYSCQLVILLLFLGYSTNKYDDVIDAWIVEIDRAISESENPLQYRIQLDVFILELKQNPSDLSAFGLFTVDNSSLSTVLGFTVNVMMVLIQFL